jgi:nucleobase:cation symporter-1, NCS1 family
LLVLVAGGLLVPGLSFPVALFAIVLGSVVGVMLLALGGAFGARYGIPTMVVFRPVLGIRGSWIPSGLNALQLVGWTAVELWAMSFVADIVVEQIFGFSARWLWLVAAALICTGLALWGPVGVTRVWMERFGAWVIGAISVIVTILVLTNEGIGDALSAPGDGSMTFGPALDLVIALPISWVPLVADYTRFARKSSSAFAGTFWGFLIANIWLYALGALIVLGTGTDPSPAGMAAGILALAGGSIAGLLFLTGLLVGETDEAFADIYSAAVCLQNIVPWLSQRVLTLGIATISTVLAWWLTMERYEAFLFLIGSVFVPLLGVLASHYLIKARRRIDVAELYRPRGAYWFSSGFRVSALLPWIAGFAVYHWILPTGPEWWIEGAGNLFGEPLVVKMPWLNASIPSFGTAFLIGLALQHGVYHPKQPRRRGDS